MREPERVEQPLVHQRIDRLRAEPPRQAREPGEEQVPGRAAHTLRRLGAPEALSLVLLVETLELRVSAGISRIAIRRPTSRQNSNVASFSVSISGRQPKRAFQRIGSKTNDESTYRKSSFAIW